MSDQILATTSNVSEAPLQMKSNCGCFLIDDFGRQRIEAVELLNRWIVPLENRYDFLTLSTGKKIQVPFEQLIIFSTNLDPARLTDEAFLRRIPYKIEIGDPSQDEFHELFELYGDIFDCEYRPDVVDVLIEKHYQQAGRPMRRCHPRDLLQQIRNFCSYNELTMEMRDEYFDRVVKSYFSVVIDQSSQQTEPQADVTPTLHKAKPAPSKKPRRRERFEAEEKSQAPNPSTAEPEQTFNFDSPPSPPTTPTMSATMSPPVADPQPAVEQMPASAPSYEARSEPSSEPLQPLHPAPASPPTPPPVAAPLPAATVQPQPNPTNP